MILRRLLAARDWTALALAILVGLQVAIAPLSDAAARGGVPATDPFSVICSHDGTAAAPDGEQDRHPADKGSCCEAGCLMGVAGLAPPAQDAVPFHHDLRADAALSGFAPDAVPPPARPHGGAPQSPRGPPSSIG